MIAGEVREQGEPYTWLIIASVGFLLAQSALHAGPLDASMPLVVIADPGASALIGIVAFHERVAFRPIALVIEVASVAVIVLSVFTLTRSRVECEQVEREPAAPRG